MMKWIITILIMICMLSTAQAICCEKGEDCIISETCQDTDCGDCSIQVYNRDGTVNISYQTMTAVSTIMYIYNASDGLNQYTIYPYAINCTAPKICSGDCYIEIKDYCGRVDEMTIAIALFLLVFNIGIFLMPMFTKKFSNSKAGDYVIRKLIIIAGILFLWFNANIFRQLARDFNLNIDNYLNVYWWFFTIIAFMSIFIIVYVMTVGAIKLAKEVKLRRRMGDDQT